MGNETRLLKYDAAFNVKRGVVTEDCVIPKQGNR